MDTRRRLPMPGNSTAAHNIIEAARRRFHANSTGQLQGSLAMPRAPAHYLIIRGFARVERSPALWEEEAR